jgi:hypothetical protein
MESRFALQITFSTRTFSTKLATACRIGGQGAKGWIESNTPFEKYCSMPGRGGGLNRSTQHTR